MSKHFIACAGLHGCTLQCQTVGDTRTQVAESMAQIHELGKRRTAQLIHDWYLELNLERDGNQYIEITECDRDDPEEHGDF